MENAVSFVHQQCHLVLTHLVHLFLKAKRETPVHLGLLEIMVHLVYLASLVLLEIPAPLECVRIALQLEMDQVFLHSMRQAMMSSPVVVHTLCNLCNPELLAPLVSLVLLGNQVHQVLMDTKALLVNLDNLALQAHLVPQDYLVQLVQQEKTENLEGPADLVNVACLVLLVTKVPLACLGCPE